MYGNKFLSRGFTDQREILHGGSATSQTGFLLFWGIVLGMAKFWASTGGRVVGYASCWSTCFFDIRTLWRSAWAAKYPNARNINGGLDQFPKRLDIGLLILPQSENAEMKGLMWDTGLYYKLYGVVDGA